MTIKEITSKEELQNLYDKSALTWEGLAEDDFELALDMCSKHGENGVGYLTMGRTMNRLCNLVGENAYPNDLHIFSIVDFKVLALTVGARWMDDIIDNNARYGGKKFFRSR